MHPAFVRAAVCRSMQAPQSSVLFFFSAPHSFFSRAVHADSGMGHPGVFDQKSRAAHRWCVNRGSNQARKDLDPDKSCPNWIHRAVRCPGRMAFGT